jgi:eukaryotic-like serine/threonine-protein kinase
MLTAGSRIGAYEIKSPLGEGGMGVVFRALDTKLQREVALKLLPEHFADDPERLARFQREAQVLATLNHPNIAHIHGLEDSTGRTCIVMELVEGETLQDRIQRGSIPLSEALPVARQICEALEAAHGKGIIHRDLKPANVKVTPQGRVKVLDFGLAKAVEPASAKPSLSNSPTLSMAATNAGMILGTAAYMSPEQAKGRAVDRRTDIFAFGCVLFEMLTGRHAFEGDDVTEIVGRVVTAEPDWSKLPAETPASIERVIRRAMKKDPRHRLGDIHDARLEIEEALSEPAGASKAVHPSGPSSRAAWATAGVALAAAAVFAIPAVRYFRDGPAPEAPEMRVEITTPSTSAPLQFELSPDGRYLAFVASGGGPQRLWLRALDKTAAQPLTGTEGAEYPFWSADGRSIAFSSAGKLKRVDIAGGSPQVVAGVSPQFGGTWNADGTILFSTFSGVLFRVSGSGGVPVAVTRLDPSQVQHRYPRFLPDGRHYFFYAIGSADTSGIYLASLDGESPKRLMAADTAGLYLAPNMVLFGRGKTIMAQHLDLKRGELVGEAVGVADFDANSALGLSGLSVSANNQIALRGGGELRSLRWYDRSGHATTAAGDPDTGLPVYPELSPDGCQVAVSKTVQTNQDIWLRDLLRGSVTRLTFDTAVDSAPIWSPDGMRIVFGSNRKGPYQLYAKSSSGAGGEDLLLESPNTVFPLDWSKDGRFLLYSEVDVKTGRDLWALPVTGSDRKPIPIGTTTVDEQNGQFSPDGRWVAYQINESGEFQIVVQPFPQPTGKWQVSTGGGTDPRWRADGKELYFISPDGKMMASSINVQGSTFAATAPVALFQASPVTGLGFNKQEYAVSRDGRFLINQPAEASINAPITLILNWKPRP